jgi:ATPase subunit of ABC transporter with duplicated ATPase domains
MLSTANITMQFGAKPLFENVSVKFGNGNRYGLIGANGCGKSTFMKILGRDLDQTSGEVMLDKTERLGKLRQDQFAYEDNRVLDVVMMGHDEMWAVMSERDAIYANPDASEEDYMRAADLEAEFAEYDGYTAEARAGELLLGLGIAIELHQGNMSAVAPGFKLLQPGHPVAGRADQQSGYQHHPLAGKHPQRAHLHHGHYLARPPLPEQRVHPHVRSRFW